MATFTTEDKSGWQWTMMIMQPSFITPELVDEAIREVQKKKKLPALERLRMEAFEEGKCAQIMHVGPFSEEGPTVEKLHRYIDAHGELRGKHHEIYLSDIRKANPTKWKTVIRQPMA